MIEVIPAIMPDDVEDFRMQAQKFRGFLETIQIDVMDGAFVPERSWPYGSSAQQDEFIEIQKEDRAFPYWEDFDFEVDLMVAHPSEVLDQWIAFGATRIIVHAKSNVVIPEIISHVRERSGEQGSAFAIEIGIACGSDKDVEMVLPHIEQLDFVQVMGIARIGFQGEAFDERVLNHIRAIKKEYPHAIISVDGGVNSDTAPALIEAGAMRLVSGSFLREAPDVKDAIASLKNSENDIHV